MKKETSKFKKQIQLSSVRWCKENVNDAVQIDPGLSSAYQDYLGDYPSVMNGFLFAFGRVSFMFSWAQKRKQKNEETID